MAQSSLDILFIFKYIHLSIDQLEFKENYATHLLRPQRHHPD